MGDEILVKTEYVSPLDDVQIEGLISNEPAPLPGAEKGSKLVKEPVISKKVQATIEKVREADFSRISVSENVKNRVARGIQYLFSNSSDVDFMDTTENVAAELMKAIENNGDIVADV